MRKKVNSLIFVLQFITLYGIRKGIKLFVDIKLTQREIFKIPGLINPIHLRRSTSDIPTFFQVFFEEQYNVSFNSAPSVIIDAGANVGLFAVLMKNKFPEAKIICIEPDPENFKILMENVSGYSNIYCENAGLWHTNTRLKVYDKYQMGKWGMVVEEDINEGTIAAISVEFLISKYQLSLIDLFKIDIETSEKQLFSKGAEYWVPKTKKMIVELHDWVEPGCAKIFFEAINNLYPTYKFMCKGENVIIDNSELNQM